MIVMNIELDNLFSFENFNMNFSYPKKIVNSSIKNEYLISKPNFRYKKVNVLMGPNASGKTSLGKAFMTIFNFLSEKEIVKIEKNIKDKEKPAYFSIDFLVDEDNLYRVECKTLFQKSVELEVYFSKILKSDSYESCVKKLKKIEKEDLEKFNIESESLDYVQKLSAIPSLGWLFTFPNEEGATLKLLTKDENDTMDIRVLKSVLKTLDTSIIDVVKSKEVKNSYIIKTLNGDIFVQDGQIVKKNILSSGTKAGLEIAYVISAICKNSNGFYYCDERFSYIQTDVEQAIFSLMIEFLHPNAQLFFTTHNLDLLEMNLPIHTFSFLRKKDKIEVVYPTDYIQKNDISLRNAVKNDIFDIAPNINDIFELEGVCFNGC